MLTGIVSSTNQSTISHKLLSPRLLLRTGDPMKAMKLYSDNWYWCMIMTQRYIVVSVKNNCRSMNFLNSTSHFCS